MKHIPDENPGKHPIKILAKSFRIVYLMVEIRYLITVFGELLLALLYIDLQIYTNFDF